MQIVKNLEIERVNLKLFEHLLSLSFNYFNSSIISKEDLEIYYQKIIEILYLKNYLSTYILSTLYGIYIYRKQNEKPMNEIVDYVQMYRERIFELIEVEKKVKTNIKSRQNGDGTELISLGANLNLNVNANNKQNYKSLLSFIDDNNRMNLIILFVKIAEILKFQNLPFKIRDLIAENGNNNYLMSSFFEILNQEENKKYLEREEIIEILLAKLEMILEENKKYLKTEEQEINIRELYLNGELEEFLNKNEHHWSNKFISYCRYLLNFSK